MNCSELVELVTDYLEGSMPADQWARFDEHVSRCDGCTTYLGQFRITIRLTGMLCEEQIAPDAAKPSSARSATGGRRPSSPALSLPPARRDR